MRARTIMSGLLALALVAGVVTAPPAFADDAPPVGAEAPPEDGDGEGEEPEDSGDESAGGGDGDTGSDGGSGDDGEDGFGIFAAGDPIEPLAGMIAPHERSLDFEFAEPQTLYTAIDFPVPVDEADWDQGVATREQRSTSVRSVVTADLNSDTFDDVVSLVYVLTPAPMGMGLRTPGRAFAEGAAQQIDPAVGGWYVVVHFGSELGLGHGSVYPVGTAKSDFMGTLAVGDVDGENGPDIVYSNRGDRQVVAMLNDGDGGFTGPVVTELGMGLDRGITLGDIDDDGMLDLIAPSIGVTSSTGDDRVLVLLGIGDGTFIAGAELEVTKPANVALIDTEGDGHPALLITSFDSATPATLWRGSGATWTADAGVFGGVGAVAAWVGDFYGDGDADAALLLRSCGADQKGRCLVPLRNDGALGFTALTAVESTYLSVPDSGHLEAAFPAIDGTTIDVDGDGHLDILMPGALGDVGIAYGDGAGSFADLRSVAGAAGWEPADAGGWDATVDPGSSWPTTWGTELQAMSVAALDVAGDGTMDLLVGTASGNFRTYAGQATGRLSLVRGAPDSRAFVAADAWGVSDQTLSADFRSAQPVLADVTGDSHDDVVFLQEGAGSSAAVMVSRWEDGHFLLATSIGSMPAGCDGWRVGRLVVADVVGDSSLDVACADSSKIYLARGSPSDLDAWTSLGDLSALTPKGEGIHTLVATDLDGDGDLDLAFSASTVSGQFLDGTAFGWIENRGGTDGFASPAWLQPSGFNDTDHSGDSNLPHGPVIADLTGDGRADFAFAARQKSSKGVYDLFVYVNDGALAGSPQTFTARPGTVDLDSNSTSTAYLDAADVTGDGVVDLILTGVLSIGSSEDGGRMRVLPSIADAGHPGRGTGDFATGTLYPAGAALPGHRVADLNSDSYPDLISPTGYRSVELRAGRADGTLGTPQVFGTPGAELNWVAVTDVDANGSPDVIAAIAEAGAGVAQLAVLRNLAGGSTDPEDPTCEPGDEDCEPVCEPGDEGCDDDPGTPPAKTVNLVMHDPAWTPAGGSATDPLTGVTRGTVTVTVENIGNSATGMAWMDGLWLSEDDVWGPDDVLLKAIPRTGTLGAGGSATASVEIALAAPVAGTYHLIVRADARGEIAETMLDGDGAPIPAENDNDAASSLIVFNPPVLDVPASGTEPGTATTVTGPGAVVRIPEIEVGTAAVRLTVAADTGSIVDGFAVRASKLPTATAADQRVIGAGSVTLVPRAGDRYVLLNLAEGQTAIVTATLLPFGVGAIAPKRVSVGGPVSFVLTGVGLGTANAITAIAPDDSEIPGTGLIRHDNGDLTVTFDLTERNAGTFAVRVDSADASATLAAAFTAVADRVGTVRTSVLIPTAVRSNSVGEVWITYANDGLTDAVAPILRVSSRGAKPPTSSPYPLGRFYVSPEVPWAPVGVIPAGASGRIVIPFLVDSDGPNGLPASVRTDTRQYAFLVDEFGIDSIAPYNAIADFADDLADLPEEARTAVALELAARLGDTGGSYLAAMHRVRAGMGSPTADMDDLRDVIFANARAAATTGAVRGTLLDAASRPVPNRGLHFDIAGDGDDEARTIDARTDDLGVWSAPGLAGAATANVRVDGYGPGPVHTLTNPLSTDPIDLTLPGWSSLTGAVTGLDGRFAADAVVTVLSADGSRWVRAVTNADGVYRFDGVEPGSHRIAAVGADGGLAAADLVMPAAATAKNLQMLASDLASGGGTVMGALPPLPISGLPAGLDVPADVSVWVDDGAGLRPVEAEADGSFAVVGAPGAEATLWLFDAFYGVLSASVTFPAAGATVGVEWGISDRTLSIPVTVAAGDELPPVYLQPAATADHVPMPGADAGVLLIPSGLAGDPVTWSGGMSAGEQGLLSVAVPPGDYRVTVLGADGDDVAEIALAASDVTVSFGPRPAPMTASGTAMSGAATVDGGFVELVSTNLTPARRYVTATGDPAAEPPTIPGAWSLAVATGIYALTYYDAAGNLVATGTYPGGLPFRGAGRAFAVAPSTAPATHGPSYLALPPLRAEGEYGPAGGSVAELEAAYKAKFDVKTTPATDPMVAQAQAMPYPNQPPPDQCKMLDYSWLDAAKIAANRAEATRQLIWELISDTAKTRNWMLGEAALRAVMFLGEIANLVLGVIAVKQAVGKAAATAAAREEAKALAAQGIKPPAPTGIIDLRWQPVLENIQKISGLASAIYTNAKAAITSAEPASAGTVVGMLGEIGNLALELTKDIGIMATSAAVSLVRDVVGPVAAVNNMITQVREAGESYRSAIAQLDAMKSALDQLYVSYDFDLSRAHQAWFDFQVNRFPEITLDDCDGSGSGGDDDEDPDNPGDDPNDPNNPNNPDNPNGPKDPPGPKPGPKPSVGPTVGTPVAGTDPNEIVGPHGVGDDRWVQTGTALGYTISFENVGPGTDPAHIPDGWTLADAAPAAAVTIEFPLPDAADIDTVELGDFGFGVGAGEVRYVPEVGGTSYESVQVFPIDILEPYGDGMTDLTLMARAWLDRAERTAHWEITLVDPATGLPHAYPGAGFLPPEPGGDDAGAGQGWATVSFATDPGAASGMTVAAQAEIVFDTNEPISTNEWTNRLDGTAPTASISAAATTEIGRTVTVSLDDAGGSGAGLVDIYRSVDGGSWLPWLYQVKPGTKVLLGTAGQQVELRARAVDQVGNAGALGGVAATRLVAAPSGNGGDSGGPGSSGGAGGSDAGAVGVLPDNATRVAGSNRYGTAAEIAALFGTADSVIVANGEDHKQGFDALAANHLAGRADAPIVLTRAGVLPAESLAAICSVLRGSTAATRTIYILGAADTVSASVAAQLQRPCSPALGNVKVVRIGGSDRYETAALIATRDAGPGGDVRATGGASPRTVFLASGVVNADALAAGAVSAQFGIPVLLTGPDRLPEVTAAALKTLRTERVVVLGGVDRVSAAVKAQLRALGVGQVMTIAGEDRFETSALIAAWAHLPLASGGLGHAGSLIGLANGVTGFADALAAGPLLGRKGGMLLLTAPATLPESLRRFLAGLSERSLLALGGPTTVADSVIAAGARAAG